MIEPEHPLPITRQAQLLQISRSSVYYQPQGVSNAGLTLMRSMDELHLQYPFAGSRMLRDMLNSLGYCVGRKHVRTLMKRMGVEALYRKPSTTQRNPKHRIYPYLLKNLSIARTNQVWAMDITYIPMAKGFVYLAVVMDWYSRKILSWKVSNTLETQFCMDAVHEAIQRYGKPEIFNTDQGSQFTSEAFTGMLQTHEIAISMDAKGCWRDNVMVERFWRSIKYEEVYLHAYESVPQARQALGRYIDFYNHKRPHSSLDKMTPEQAFFKLLPSIPKAA